MNRIRPRSNATSPHRTGFDPWRPADLFMAVRILVKMLLVRIHLSMFDYDATSRLVARRVERSSLKTAVTESDQQFANHVGLIANGLSRRVPFETKCLVRSLAVWWELRKKGLPAELKLGVAKKDAFAAHAWVELVGSPVTDTADMISEYAAFDRSM